MMNIENWEIENEKLRNYLSFILALNLSQDKSFNFLFTSISKVPAMRCMPVNILIYIFFSSLELKNILASGVSNKIYL